MPLKQRWRLSAAANRTRILVNSHAVDNGVRQLAAAHVTSNGGRTFLPIHSVHVICCKPSDTIARWLSTVSNCIADLGELLYWTIGILLYLSEHLFVEDRFRCSGVSIQIRLARTKKDSELESKEWAAMKCQRKFLRVRLSFEVRIRKYIFGMRGRCAKTCSRRMATWRNRRLAKI